MGWAAQIHEQRSCRAPNFGRCRGDGRMVDRTNTHRAWFLREFSGHGL